MKKLKLDWSIKPWERWTLSAFGVLVALGFVIGLMTWNEAHMDPRATRYNVEVDGLPSGEEVTIAFMSDTHVNETPLSSPVDTERLGEIAELVNDLEPDIVILGGDYIATTGAAGDVPLGRAVAPFSHLQAPLGVYAVVGNHDCQEPENTSKSMKEDLLAAKARPLVNEVVEAGPIILAGLDELWCGNSDIGTAERALSISEGRPVVVISHNPDVFPQMPRAIALTLAGHTHAGQIAPPFIDPPASVSRFGNRYRYGLIEEQGKRMIVSSGVGGMPFRWNAEPEIVLVTLKSKI